MSTHNRSRRWFMAELLLFGFTALVALLLVVHEVWGSTNDGPDPVAHIDLQEDVRGVVAEDDYEYSIARGVTPSIHQGHDFIVIWAPYDVRTPPAGVIRIEAFGIRGGWPGLEDHNPFGRIGVDLDGLMHYVAAEPDTGIEYERIFDRDPVRTCSMNGARLAQALGWRIDRTKLERRAGVCRVHFVGLRPEAEIRFTPGFGSRMRLDFRRAP